MISCWLITVLQKTTSWTNGKNLLRIFSASRKCPTPFTPQWRSYLLSLLYISSANLLSSLVFPNRSESHTDPRTIIIRRALILSSINKIKSTMRPKKKRFIACPGLVAPPLWSRAPSPPFHKKLTIWLSLEMKIVFFLPSQLSCDDFNITPICFSQSAGKIFC